MLPLYVMAKGFRKYRLIIEKSIEKMQAICELLKKNVPYYNWVGFYFKKMEIRRAKTRAHTCRAPT